MLITPEFTKIWNALARMGFEPTTIDENIIDVTTNNTSDELDFCAAVMGFSVYLIKYDMKEKERYYQVGNYIVRVWMAF